MKALLLDFDGLLCDSLTLYYDLYQEACRKWNKRFPLQEPGEFRDWYDPRWEKNYFQMGFSPKELQEVQVWSEQHLDYSRAALYPGVAEALVEWSQHAVLAVVSTTPSALIRRRLAQEPGLLECFTMITGGDDGSSEKRLKVAYTLEALELKEGVMAGDTPLDIDAGKRNGLKTVAVTYGWVSPDRVRSAEPSVLVQEPRELFQAVMDCLS